MDSKLFPSQIKGNKFSDVHNATHYAPIYI